MLLRRRASHDRRFRPASWPGCDCYVDSSIHAEACRYFGDRSRRKAGLKACTTTCKNVRLKPDATVDAEGIATERSIITSHEPRATSHEHDVPRATDSHSIMSKKTSVKKKSRVASPKPQAAGKYVYLFGKAKTDGNGSMKPLLGGKGANLAEMCRIGLPVPPGFTITTEVCTYFYDHKRTYPPALKAQMQAGVASIEKQTGQEVRRCEESAARLGPLRCARLHARHDGHDPEPRAQRSDGRGARPRRPAIPASRGTATAGSCRCTATSCSACRSARMKTTSRSKR